MLPEMRPIAGFPGYAITRSGDVYAVGNLMGTPRLLMQSEKSGTKRVQLRSPTGSGKTSRTIARLLRETWGA